MNVPAKASVPQGDVMESVIAKGDLAKLTPDERVRYYTAVCKSLGLNALTQPLSYITLNGKLTLYATRTCTDQLRKINGVSLEIVSRHIDDDILTVHVKARTPDGRVDEDLGSVPFPSTLKGDARANAALKAVTKAKRRATLSICGLGWLDETEVPPPHDPITGEITESADVEETPHRAADAAPRVSIGSASGAALSVEDLAREAARRGEAIFGTFYHQRTRPELARINAIGAELRKILDSRASPAGTDPHSVATDDAREEGGEPDVSTAVHDPAAADPGLPDFIHFRSDVDPEHRRILEAYQAGKQAKSDGHSRKSIPGEYREPSATREALAWTAGFDGQSLPEFNEP